jgi:hypothetical protein
MKLALPNTINRSLRLCGESVRSGAAKSAEDAETILANFPP